VSTFRWRSWIIIIPHFTFFWHSRTCDCQSVARECLQFRVPFPKPARFRTDQASKPAKTGAKSPSRKSHQNVACEIDQSFKKPCSVVAQRPMTIVCHREALNIPSRLSSENRDICIVRGSRPASHFPVFLMLAVVREVLGVGVRLVFLPPNDDDDDSALLIGRNCGPTRIK